MRISDLKKVLYGKDISYYSGWNGTEVSFTIGFLKWDLNHKWITLKDRRDGSKIISIPTNQIEQLLTNGQVEVKNEIERCIFHKRWTLSRD